MPSDRSGAHRLRQQWDWLWTYGLASRLETNRLSRALRPGLALRRWRWRRTHHIAPLATPVFVVGVQRSGTNMLLRGLEESPEFEVHNENDPRAFHRFRLRPDPVIRSLVERSGHRFVLLKPLCDSHRIRELLDGLGAPRPGNAVWVYRSVDGRVRSALRTFGDHNLRVLREIASGRGDQLWQAQGLSDQSRELIRSFDYDQLNAESAAALFWLVRNSLYFELGLDRREDVMLASYDLFVRDPPRTMQALCRYLDFPFHPRLVRHVVPKEAVRPLDIHPEIRRRADRLLQRLDEAAHRQVNAQRSRP